MEALRNPNLGKIQGLTSLANRIESSLSSQGKEHGKKCADLLVDVNEAVIFFL